MTAVAAEQLAALLGEVTSPGSFSARRAAPVDDLHLEVRGLGRLRLPVPDAQARRLCRLGRPARFGRGEQTLLDTRVRDTWEIPKSRVKVDKRRWNKTLVPVLEGLRSDLGLPSGCRLTAELHSMLVYARGQFFAPHQDSEKADEMVGTLVVMLPGSFKGGALVVEHAGETATYRGSKESLSFVAFYADCRHEIRPVTSGHRVVLTYNLLLRQGSAGAIATEAAPETIDAVARRVDEHFTTPPPSARGADAATAPPNRLVYLLDHEYTMRGLDWSRLKGSDARRAAVLRAAAERTDCESALALAEIHETWSCMGPEWDEPWYGHSRGGWREGWWDDDDDDEEPWSGEEGPSEADGYDLDELLDWTITLDGWIDASGARAEPAATHVYDVELCATTRTADLLPYASEYEGYMGNYGNTMDRWYRRAAVVLWPRDRDFVVRAEASATWALDALWTQIRGGDVAGARENAAALAPFWATVTRQEQRRGVLTKALRVARGLQEPTLAAMLLEPFRVELLARSHAKPLAALVDSYGQAWAHDCLAAWFGDPRPWVASAFADRAQWVTSLAGLGQALHATGDAGTATARLLIAGAWSWLLGMVEDRRRLVAPSHRAEALGELARPVLAGLEGTTAIAADDLCDEVVGALCGQGDDLLACLVPVLRAARTLPPATRTAAGLDRIARHCAEQLEARLARPPRGDDDWSLELPGGCDCADCDVLVGFLADPARQTFEWPIAKDRRRHVHTRLDSAELPVRHQTRRAGRPFTLVLSKTEDVFERDRQARRRDEADLTWLHDTWARV
jgi:predicted 2-oxoglutarate/Fe(II)-dependent dioxygenase YbiX